MDEEIHPKTLVPAIVVAGIILAFVVIAYQWSKSRPSSIVLPGGITYLGPTPTVLIPQPTQKPFDGKIAVEPNATWAERKGKIFPYTFLFPGSIALGEFPSDPYDSVTLFYPGTDANSNIFFRVEDLNKLNKKQYVGNLKSYAQDWWKDYNWTGVASISALTTQKGLSGYRASYTDSKGETSYDHVFLAVPNRADLVIWASQKLFSTSVFNRFVESISWNRK
jgi:hypothetical protein